VDHGEGAGLACCCKISLHRASSSFRRASSSGSGAFSLSHSSRRAIARSVPSSGCGGRCPHVGQLLLPSHKSLTAFSVEKSLVQMDRQNVRMPASIRNWVQPTRGSRLVSFHGKSVRPERAAAARTIRPVPKPRSAPTNLPAPRRTPGGNRVLPSGRHRPDRADSASSPPARP